MGHSKPVRLETAPTGPDKSGSKPMGKSVYLFLEFTIIRHCERAPIDQDSRSYGTQRVPTT